MVIKTEAEYNQVLEQIDALVDCPEGSPEENLLEALSILADDFENKHYPIEVNCYFCATKFNKK